MQFSVFRIPIPKTLICKRLAKRLKEIRVKSRKYFINILNKEETILIIAIYITNPFYKRFSLILPLGNINNNWFGSP